MKILVFLVLLGIQDTDSVTHSLKYFYTASSQVPNFPEFVAVGLVDDVQMIHFDSESNTAVPKQDWMTRYTQDDPQYLAGQTDGLVGTHQLFKSNIEVAKQRFNQTGGVHIFQDMYGCEWDDETGEITGFHQFGYDGEDFIALDLATATWTAPKQQAVITKHKWDKDRGFTDYWINYHAQICPDWLKKYVDYGKSSLMRTVLPSKSVFQKNPSTVRCHATGFYPEKAEMFWRKDGEEVHDGVEKGEILPNNDGTFQMSVDLKPSSDNPEDWTKYECVFQLSGVKEDITTRLERGDEFPTVAVIGAVVGLLVLACIIAGFMYWRRRKNACLRNSGFKPANASDTSSSSQEDPEPVKVNTEEQKMLKGVS